MSRKLAAHAGAKTVALAPNQVYPGDCLEGLAQIEPGTVDLAFADPPFNIGYQYDVYQDSRSEKEYLAWAKKWMSAVSSALKPTGTFWLAIGDEYAAQLKILAQDEVGFACRSWVIWYYTFGVNCTRAFSRSHTHLFYFVKDPSTFTFNADNPAVRVPSARQLVYADGRANPKGRLPDNTWILRPQDVPGGFGPDQDTWYFPRVAGTFKEREGFHGCQMPEQLLGRIIRCCSNPMEIVLDPFAGSGTTLAVAKKLGRQWIGFELSDDYVARIEERLKRTTVGGPLDGSANPLSSAPATLERDRKSPKLPGNGRATSPIARVRKKRPADRPADFDTGIVEVYRKSHGGFSVDHLLANPELNSAFLNACARCSLPGTAAEWNQALLRIRKAGKLPRLENRTRTLTFDDMDPYSFASEIALAEISLEYETTLDGILCDPKLAARFDEIAQAFAPGYSPFQYRWAALSIRKRAKQAKKLAKDRCAELCKLKLAPPKAISEINWKRHSGPGVYLVLSRSRERLYVGETLDLERRIVPMAELPAWKRLEPASVRFVKLVPADRFPLQAYLIHKLRPLLNCQLLVPDFANA